MTILQYHCDRHGISDRYCHLVMLDTTYELLRDHPDIFRANCNGVGSTVGWSRYFYHFIPNTIWGLSVSNCSDVHDVEYVFPDTYYSMSAAIRAKQEADERLYQNLCIHIRRQESWLWLEETRLHRAAIYFAAVKNLGDKSFLNGKTILHPDK